MDRRATVRRTTKTENETYSEPSDIALSVIGMVSKYCCVNKRGLKYAAKMVRVSLSTALNIVICSLFVRAFMPELQTAVFYAPMALVELILLIVEGLLLRGVMVGTVKQRTFLIVYKSCDFIFSGVNGGFMIYEREKMNFTQWEQTTAVVITAIDLLDPIEIVLACFWKYR